ncbi:hypothetical protein MN608_09215 [Microdochium nivale]|nr:hypothetical protein MN608_09215 [Microdochium nivale]
MPSKLLPVTDTERMRLLHLARTLLRLSPVLTSSIGATFSFAFGVFFAGFRETRAPGNAIAITTTTTTAAKSGKSDTSRTSSAAAAAKWEVLPTWFGRIRAAALRTIFTAYNASIVLGAANALLLWSPASSPPPLLLLLLLLLLRWHRVLGSNTAGVVPRRVRGGDALQRRVLRLHNHSEACAAQLRHRG